MDKLPGTRVELLGVGVHPLTLAESVKAIGNWVECCRAERRRAQQYQAQVRPAHPEASRIAEKSGPAARAHPPDGHPAKAGSPVRARQVITLNPEMLYQARGDGELRELLNQGDLVVADGHGIVWAAARLGHPLPERVAGIDLIQSLATRATSSGWRLYLLGGEPGVAEAAANSLRRRHPGLLVVGASHGYFTAAGLPSLFEQIRAANPDLLLVGLGFPKQERFIRDHRPDLGALVAVGVGGSFDVLSGRLRRSPVWMRRLRLEWLYRACQEPARWRRLLVLPLFMLMVLSAGRPGAPGARSTGNRQGSN